MLLSLLLLCFVVVCFAVSTAFCGEQAAAVSSCFILETAFLGAHFLAPLPFGRALQSARSLALLPGSPVSPSVLDDQRRKSPYV